LAEAEEEEEYKALQRMHCSMTWPVAEPM